MVKLATAGAIAGAWFVVWQLWNMRRKTASTANYDCARAHPGSTRMSPMEVYAAQREANGAPARLLSVSSFSIANLDVSQREVQPRRQRRPACACRDVPRAPAPPHRVAAPGPALSCPPPEQAAGETSAAQCLGGQLALVAF